LCIKVDPISKRFQKKKPQHRAGVVSLFAVTHQGPAQGGKAGGSELPAPNIAKILLYFNPPNKIFSQHVAKNQSALHF
jgi:hypothetical protein